MTIPYIIGLLFGLAWVAGFIATLVSLDCNGNRFQRWVVGPIILFFVWPYVAAVMNTDH